MEKLSEEERERIYKDVESYSMMAEKREDYLLGRIDECLNKNEEIERLKNELEQKSLDYDLTFEEKFRTNESLKSKLQASEEKIKELEKILQLILKELQHLMDYAVENHIIDLDDETDGLKDYRKTIEKAENLLTKQ